MKRSPGGSETKTRGAHRKANRRRRRSSQIEAKLPYTQTVGNVSLPRSRKQPRRWAIQEKRVAGHRLTAVTGRHGKTASLVFGRLAWLPAQNVDGLSTPLAGSCVFRPYVAPSSRHPLQARVPQIKLAFVGSQSGPVQPSHFFLRP